MRDDMPAPWTEINGAAGGIVGNFDLWDLWHGEAP